MCKPKRRISKELVFQLVKCNFCGELKQRAKANEYKRLYYVDEHKDRWEGKKCPSCLLKKHKVDYEKRKALKIII